MIDINEFRENARHDGLCQEYSSKWDSCASKKQLMDIALGAKGLDYLGDSIAKGWGISSDEILSKFANFINGKYIFDNGRYSSKMYCRYNTPKDAYVNADTTAMIVIDSDIDIRIEDGGFCEIYVTGHSSIRLSGGGRAVVVRYGGKESSRVTSTCASFKLIDKSDKDKYE